MAHHAVINRIRRSGDSGGFVFIACQLLVIYWRFADVNWTEKRKLSEFTYVLIFYLYGRVTYRLMQYTDIRTIFGRNARTRLPKYLL